MTRKIDEVKKARENLLWEGSSVFCQYSHHIEQHVEINPLLSFYDNCTCRIPKCPCKGEFRSYKKEMNHTV